MSEKSTDTASDASPIVRYMVVRALSDKAQKLEAIRDRLADDVKNLGLEAHPELKGIELLLNEIKPQLERITALFKKAEHEAQPKCCR